MSQGRCSRKITILIPSRQSARPHPPPGCVRTYELWSTDLQRISRSSWKDKRGPTGIGLKYQAPSLPHITAHTENKYLYISHWGRGWWAQSLPPGGKVTPGANMGHTGWRALLCHRSQEATIFVPIPRGLVSILSLLALDAWSQTLKGSAAQRAQFCWGQRLWRRQL